MLALKDHQLQFVMAAANRLPAEKRGTFLERLEARLRFRAGHLTAADHDDAVRVALQGLTQHPRPA